MSNELKPLPRDRKGNLSIRKVFRKIIYDRNECIKADPAFLRNEENWCGVTTPYYELRNLLGHLGYNIAETYTNPIFDVHQSGKNKGEKKERWGRVILDDARDYIQGQMLRDICDELHRRRDELGIYVQARCTFAFRGKIGSIGIEDIDTFKEKGIIIGFVEKSNIARKLAPFLQDYGIALIENGGNFVEYAKLLCKRAYNLGCNLAYLTDNDISGYSMCLPMPFGKRIAIDLADIRELAKMKRHEDRAAGLTDIQSEQQLIEVVQELYNPNANQLTYVRDKYQCLRAIFGDYDSEENESTKEDIEQYNVDTIYKLMKNGGETWNFIKTRRIELDLVVNVFGPKLFAQFIVKKMREAFEVNDYTRAVSLQQSITYPLPVPKEVDDFIIKILQLCCDEGYHKKEEIFEKLREVHGILDSESKEKMIGDKIVHAEGLTPRVQELLYRLSKFKFPKPMPRKKTNQRSNIQ